MAQTTCWAAFAVEIRSAKSAASNSESRKNAPWRASLRVITIVDGRLRGRETERLLNYLFGFELKIRQGLEPLRKFNVFFNSRSHKWWIAQDLIRKWAVCWASRSLWRRLTRDEIENDRVDCFGWCLWMSWMEINGIASENLKSALEAWGRHVGFTISINMLTAQNPDKIIKFFLL